MTFDEWWGSVSESFSKDADFKSVEKALKGVAHAAWHVRSEHYEAVMRRAVEEAAIAGWHSRAEFPSGPYKDLMDAIVEKVIKRAREEA